MTIFEHLKDIFRNVENPVILEIGANTCEDTYDIILNANLRAQSKHLKYYAFEPEPKNIAKIKQSHILNYVTLVEKAVGSHDGKATFYQSSGNIDPRGPDWHGSGSIKSPKKHLEIFPWCKFNTSVEVDVTRLDTFFDQEQLNHIDLIYADTQGAENDIILGGQKSLLKTRYFYCEYYESEMYEGQIPLSQWMKNLPRNWEITELWPNDVLLRNKDYHDTQGI